MEWSKEKQEKKVFDIIIYVIFLAFMCILVFLFTGIITFLSSVIPNKALNYIIVIIGSLIIGGLVYSLITKVTKSEVRVLLAGIICPFTGILNLLLISHVISDMTTNIKETLQNAVLLFNAGLLNPEAAAGPAVAAILFYILFNLVFIVHIAKENKKKLFKWYAFAPIVFLLAAITANAIYEHYVTLGSLLG
jgi:hypothetical protein